MDQSKKTMRHFYCRDVLWETFEQMANDFDCSIDYLINEAMRFYARSKNYNAGAAPPSSPSVPQQSANPPPAQQQNGPMGYARPAAVTNQAMPAARPPAPPPASNAPSATGQQPALARAPGPPAPPPRPP